MTYDGFTLAAVIAELSRTITGARVQKIRQLNDTDVIIEVRGPGHSYMLFFSVDARFARAYLTASSSSGPPEPPHFCMVLRKHLQGAFVERIEQAGLDRIVRVHFQYPGHTELVLIFEIMGKHSNLILTDTDGKILGAAKHIGSSVSRFRQVLPGRQYTPPPATNKIDLRRLDPAAFDDLWHRAHLDSKEAAGVRAWLLGTFDGFGPFLADEITARASADGEVSPEALREEMLGIGEMVRSGAFVPVFIASERGEGVMAYPMPSVQFPASQQHPRASINEALDTLFRTLVTRSLLEDERAQTLTAIRRAVAARKQALKSMDRTAAESEKAERYRQIGELLLGSLNAIEKGARTVALVDYFDPEMPEVEVELDEKLTSQQNAERYFKRYQKARDAVATTQSRQTQVMRELSRLGAAREEAEAAKSVESLKGLRKTLIDQDILRQDIVHEKHAEEFGGHRIRRQITPEGWEILYGETSQANDYLTQRVARPNDVWLHARAITGAHVIVRTAGHSGSVPRPVLARAALIAAQNSEAKHSSLVPIDHTLRKYVRKPRGSAPGFVIYRNEKTIDVDPKAG